MTSSPNTKAIAAKKSDIGRTYLRFDETGNISLNQYWH